MAASPAPLLCLGTHVFHHYSKAYHDSGFTAVLQCMLSFATPLLLQDVLVSRMIAAEAHEFKTRSHVELLPGPLGLANKTPLQHESCTIGPRRLNFRPLACRLANAYLLITYTHVQSRLASVRVISGKEVLTCTPRVGRSTECIHDITYFGGGRIFGALLNCTANDAPPALQQRLRGTPDSRRRMLQCSLYLSECNLNSNDYDV